MEHLLKAARSFAATTVLGVAAALALGVWVVTSSLIAVDQVPTGPSNGAFVVTKIDDHLSREAAERVLQDAADHYHVDIALTVPDIDGTPGEWDFFVFRGAHSSDSLRRSPFDPSVHVRTLPALTLTTEDLRGDYATTAHGHTLSDLIEQVNRAGITAETTDVPLLAAQLFLLQDPGTRLVAIATAIGVFLVFAAEALRRSRRQAVRSLCGWSRRESLVREGRDISILVVVVVALLGIVGSAVLFLYNRFSGADRLLPQLVTAWGVIGVLLIALHLALLAWPEPARTPAVISGAAPTPARSLLPLLLQIAVIFLTITGLANVTTALSATAAAESDLERQRPFAHAVRVSLTLGWALDTNSDEAIGRLVRDQMRQGVAVLAAHDPSASPEMPFGMNYVNGPDGSNHLWVNREYLNTLTLLDADGRPLRLPSSDEMSLELLIPLTLRAERGRIEAEFRKWLEFQRELGGTTQGSTDVRVHVIADDQVTPDLGDEDDPSLPPRSGNVIGVLPSEAGPASSTFLAEAAGNGQMLFTDPPRLRTAFDAAGLLSSVRSYDRFGDTLNRHVAEARGVAARLEAALVVAVSALAFATWTTVSHHAVRRRAERRIMGTVGRSPWAPHTRFLVVGTTVSALAALSAGSVSSTSSSHVLAAVGIVFGLDTIVRVGGVGLIARQDSARLRTGRPCPAHPPRLPRPKPIQRRRRD